MALPTKQDTATLFPWNVSAGDFSVEQLYQIFKQRLIEELRTKGGSDFGWISDDQRLIDTTEKKDG